jgi:hypothetical protein
MTDLDTGLFPAFSLDLLIGQTTYYTWKEIFTDVSTNPIWAEERDTEEFMLARITRNDWKDRSKKLRHKAKGSHQASPPVLAPGAVSASAAAAATAAASVRAAAAAASVAAKVNQRPVEATVLHQQAPMAANVPHTA